MQSIDIILPAYNPIPQWEEIVLEKFKALESKVNIPLTLIIVDDGSATNLENSIAILKKNIDKFIFKRHKQNKGKGAALRTGVELAMSDIILYTDIDFPYTLDSMLAIIESVQDPKTAIAIGKRNKTYYENIPKKRAWISGILKSTIKNLLRIPSYDTQCGLKAFKKEIKPIFLSTSTNRYLVDLEFLKKANRVQNVQVEPVVVDLRTGVILSEVSTQLLIKESFSFLKILFS